MSESLELDRRADRMGVAISRCCREAAEWHRRDVTLVLQVGVESKAIQRQYFT